MQIPLLLPVFANQKVLGKNLASLMLIVRKSVQENTLIPFLNAWKVEFVAAVQPPDLIEKRKLHDLTMMCNSIIYFRVYWINKNNIFLQLVTHLMDMQCYTTSFENIILFNWLVLKMHWLNQMKNFVYCSSYFVYICSKTKKD